jgi:hypothetical protein
MLSALVLSNLPANSVAQKVAMGIIHAIILEIIAVWGLARYLQLIAKPQPVVSGETGLLDSDRFN